MNAADEKNIDPIKEMTRLAQDILTLSSRGFKESYQSAQSGKLIYDSVWCRINLLWVGQEPGSNNTMHIFYGRHHAPNEGTTIFFNGEECYCWHDIPYILHFLDGRIPAEAARLKYSHALTDSFYEDELSQKYRSQPEWLAHMHVTIWQHYGQRFFDLFDLQQPDLWAQYQRFLKAVYEIAGRKPTFGPPRDKVC
jgi:hypothetical protein